MEEEEEEIETIQHMPETIAVAMDEEVTPKTETIIEQQVTTISNDQVQSFYQRFTRVYSDSLNDQLSNAKIESLKGAFGLNDRMRIIAELFNGDNEAFAEMISDLDQLNSGEIARKKLSEIAFSRQWDAEDKLVEEFVKTVNRKFD
jgi:Ca2+-binding EF-hand superfamily protein